MAGSTTELIKEKLDIVEFFRGYLPLQSAGKNFKALCPFHREKTASFMVSPDRQSWHCFGCNLGGDIFAFLMRYENLDFGEALKVLAEKAGVELQRVSPNEYRYAGLLYDANDAAKNFFRKTLAQSRVAKEYLAGRKLKEDTIEEFELGFAPAESDALNLHLIQSGFSPEDILRAGLAIKTERGMQFDRFRGRIVFPIHNHFGKTVGFTGRILPQLDTGEMGKYVNSPETPIFNKSKLLYGFWKTKNDIRKSGTVFLVEGQMDFLMSWQAGLRHVVASSGTALTPDHLKVLRRLTDELTVSFDADEAGESATVRAIDLAEASDFRVKVARFAPHKDPAEAVEADPEGFKKNIEAAKSAPEFYFEIYLPEGKGDMRKPEHLRNIRTVLGKLKYIASPIDRDFWFRELSRRVGIEEKVLQEEAERVVRTSTAFPREEVMEEGDARKAISRRDLLAQELLSYAFVKNNLDVVRDQVLYFTPPYEEVWKILERGERKSSDPSIDALIGLVCMRPFEFIASDIDKLKQHLFEEYIREKRRDLSVKVKEAEEAGDEEAVERTLKEFKQLPVI